MALRINVPDFGVGRVWAGLGGGYVWLWRELKPSGETANAGYAGYAEYAEYAVFRGVSRRDFVFARVFYSLRRCDSLRVVVCGVRTAGVPHSSAKSADEWATRAFVIFCHSSLLDAILRA